MYIEVPCHEDTESNVGSCIIYGHAVIPVLLLLRFNFSDVPYCFK